MGFNASHAQRPGTSKTWSRRELTLSLLAASVWGAACTDGTDPDPPAIEVSNRRWMVTPTSGAALAVADVGPMAQSMARAVMVAAWTPWVYETLDAVSKNPSKGPTGTTSCAISGAQRIDWTDSDRDGRLGPADTLSIHMQGCQSAQDPRAVDGGWSMQIARVLLDAQQHVAALDASGQLGALSFGGVWVESAAYQLQVTDDWGSTQRSRMALRSCTAGSTPAGAGPASVFDLDVYSVHTLLQREHHLTGRLTTGATSWCMASEVSAPMVMKSGFASPGSFSQQTADVMPSSGQLQLIDAAGARLVLQAKGPLADVLFYPAGSSQPVAQFLNLTWDLLLSGQVGAAITNG